MTIRFRNTLGNKMEEFSPLSRGKVGMYHCGPTVYDHVHIGNLRSFLLADLLRRTFEYEGYEVKQVMNITDVGIGGNNDEGEDKILLGLKREGKTVTLENMRELTQFYTERFLEDIAKINILKPHVLPKASEHLAEQIELIKKLADKGLTYQTSGAVYFDTSKDAHYGRLGRLGREIESRIESAEKKNPRDFALWKKNDSIGFPSPWGQGFPGWHIECSAMSMKYLGPSFDIHTGGLDLAPVHHNNEIAQSENACGCTFARLWLHNEFVNVSDLGESRKMAKSEGNHLTLNSLEERGFSPLAYRYLLLMAHYRTPVQFSFVSLEAAASAFEKLQKLVHGLPDGGSINDAYRKMFKEKLENDLNTAQALAILWTLAKDKDISPEDKKATILNFDKVLGLGL